MNYFYRFILFLLFPVSSLIAQNEESAEANELFNSGCYGAAYPLFLEHIKNYPENANLHYKIGACLLQSRSQKIKSLPYLKKAVERTGNQSTADRTANAPVTVYKMLGDAYFYNHLFDSAMIAYEKYRGLLDPGKPQDVIALNELKTAIDICDFARDLQEGQRLPAIFKTRIQDSEEIVEGEYNSSISADNKYVIHTFKVPLQQAAHSEDSKYFENTPAGASPETSKVPSKMHIPASGGGLDTILYSTTIGSSIDGQVILTYRNEKNEAILYLSRLKKNKWTSAEKLKKTVNTAGWETCEYLTPDGMTMYFISDRQGGFGGYDIYSCKKLANGEWSKAYNLGSSVNSKYDDVAPFMHPGGKTLYFSSNRIKPGSFDIYTSALTGISWGEPVNVGFPINRNEFDIFQVDANRKKVMVPKPVEGKKVRAKDTLKVKEVKEKTNFIVSILDQNNPPLTLFIGEVFDLTGRSVRETSITVTDNNNEGVLGRYITGNNGRFALILNTGSNHNIVYEAQGLLFQSDNITVSSDNKYFDHRRDVKMVLFEKQSKTTLNNIFFEQGKTDFTNASKVELDNVYSLMTNYPQSIAGIKHCIINKDNKKENKKLAQARAERVVGYLVNKGINKARLHAVGATKSSLPEEEEEKKKNEKKSPEKISGITEFEIETIN